MATVVRLGRGDGLRHRRAVVVALTTDMHRSSAPARPTNAQRGRRRLAALPRPLHTVVDEADLELTADIGLFVSGRPLHFEMAQCGLSDVHKLPGPGVQKHEGDAGDEPGGGDSRGDDVHPVHERLDERRRQNAMETNQKFTICIRWPDRGAVGCAGRPTGRGP